MAQVQPSPNNAQPTTNGQPPTSSSSQQVAPISWDDDRMYVHAIHPPIALLSLKGSMYTSTTTLSSVDFEKRQKSLHSKLRSETTYRHLSTLVSAFYSSTPFFHPVNFTDAHSNMQMVVRLLVVLQRQDVWSRSRPCDDLLPCALFMCATCSRLISSINSGSSRTIVDGCMRMTPVA